jgi:hypothetical protein
LTHHVALPQDFAAMQHVKRAAIPTYRFSVSYSITSSEREQATKSALQLCSTEISIYLSNLDLPPDFHEILRRNVEQVHCPHRVAKH